MSRVAPFAVAALIALAISASTPAAGAPPLRVVVPAPPAAGQWQQLGATVVSRPGKQLRFFRTVNYPKNLGLVVTSSTSQLIHVSWWSDCEVQSDDGYTEEHQQTITGTHRVIAYPPVFDGATDCYIQVTARAGRRAAVAAALFTG
jgi:hypothetical protein